MPLSFTITREDMLRGKTVEPGWYKARVKNVSQEPAGTDGSTNTWIDFTITQDGPFKEVPVRRVFNEKAPGFAVPFLVACGAPVGESGGTFDIERTKGKELLIYIINGMWNNRPQNNVEDFRPLGAPAAAPPPQMPAPTA